MTVASLVAVAAAITPEPAFAAGTFRRRALPVADFRGPAFRNAGVGFRATAGFFAAAALRAGVVLAAAFLAAALLPAAPAGVAFFVGLAPPAVFCLAAGAACRFALVAGAACGFALGLGGACVLALAAGATFCSGPRAATGASAMARSACLAAAAECASPEAA